MSAAQNVGSCTSRGKPQPNLNQLLLLLDVKVPLVLLCAVVLSLFEIVCAFIFITSQIDNTVIKEDINTASKTNF